MTATSWLAAAITLAAFLPLGWKVRGLAGPSGSVKTPLSQPAGGLSDDPFADYPDSRLLATWRQLHAEHGSDAAAMPVLYGLIESEPDNFRRRALGIALMSEWSSVDPEGAFQILWSEKKNTEHAGQMMREWLKRDPDKAASHLLAHLSGAENLAATLTKDIAELAPDHFIALLSALPLPPPSPDDVYIYNAPPEPSREDFEIFARRDFQAAMEALPLLKGKVLAGARTTIATLMAEKNPASAMEWARGLSTKEEKNAAGETVIRLWAEANPAAALAGLDPARDSKKLAELVLEAAANKDLDAAIRMKQDHAGKFTESSWNVLSGPISRKFDADPMSTLTFLEAQPADVQKTLVNALSCEGLKPEALSGLWSWILQRKPEGMAEQFSWKLMNHEMWENPDAGLRRLAALPPEWLMDQCRNAEGFADDLSSARMEDLLGTVPAEARIPLLKAAFSHPIRDTPPDVLLWSKRLEELPLETRAEAAGQFASELIYGAPQLAVAFAESMPEGPVRLAAYERLVGSWVYSEPYEASAWVDTLPPGPGRDVAAAGLVLRLAQSDREAALTWAADIGEPEMRLQQLTKLLSQIAKDAPSKIPDLLNNPVLSAADRGTLDQALSKPNSSP